MPAFVLEIPTGRGRYGSGIPCSSLRIPLDVVFVDEDMGVVDTATLKPWQIYNPDKASKVCYL